MTTPEAASILGSRNPYEIIGIDRTAAYTEMQKAFRRKMKKVHPDHGGDEAEARLVLAAWEILKIRHEPKKDEEPDETTDEVVLGPAIASKTPTVAVAEVVELEVAEETPTEPEIPQALSGAAESDFVELEVG